MKKKRRVGPPIRRFFLVAIATAFVMLMTSVAPVHAAGAVLDSPPESSADDTPSQAPEESSPPSEVPPADEPTDDAPPVDSGPAHSVPSPRGNSAVITVKVGGARTGAKQVGNLAGVVLRLHNDGSRGPGSALGNSWARCTSDADGDCSFVVPETQPQKCRLIVICDPAGANYDRQFWVVQESAPSGWSANDTLNVTGGDKDYAFRTGSQLRSGTTYRSGSDFMDNPRSTTTSDSQGIWQNSLSNQPLEARCSAGLSVALVLDLSASVGNSGATGDLKNASKGMVDSLAGTNSSMALFTFASDAPRNNDPTGQNYPSMNIDSGSNAQTIKNRIDGYETGGGTNWDQGLWQAAAANQKFDLVIVVTDGMPTHYGDVRIAGSTTRFIDMENAIYSANAIKAKGSRLLAVGVGGGVSGGEANLAAISGPTKYSTGANINTADYFQTGWSELADLLSQVAKGATCQADIVVSKATLAYGASTAAPGGAGWKFRVTANSGTVRPGSEQTTGADSKAKYQLRFASPTASAAQVSISELLSSTQTGQGWTLENVKCTVNGRAVTVNRDNVRLSVASGDKVDCTVTNKQTLKPGIEIVKQAWDTPTAAGLPDAKEIPAGATVTDGTTITWTYTVKNTGQTVLDDVSVVDDKLAATAVSCPKKTLAVGESMRCTASGKVTP